jgi:phosphatidylglycerophosphate synthase
VTHDAALYFATDDDRAASLLPVAGVPLAFRVVMAAVRAGLSRVGVPSMLRGTAVEAAIARTRSARAAVTWLEPDSPPPASPVVLLPASAVVEPAALAPLAGRAVVTVLPASRGGEPAAPVVSAPVELARPLWRLIAAGAPLGDALARTLARATPSLVPGAPVCRVTTPEDAASAERALFVRLGSPIDSAFDRAFHRQLSRHVSAQAVRLGIGPNPLTLASLLVGLGAAWCLAQAQPWLAAAGLAVYAAAVVLDHADGEVARLTFTESDVGEWLDVGCDTVVHAAMVIAMGAAAHAVAGGGWWLGVAAAAGFVVSATVVKLWPSPRTDDGVGRTLEALSARDGFYVMVGLFIAGLALAPWALPVLMVVVALGSHAYWIARVADRFVPRPG